MSVGNIVLVLLVAAKFVVCTEGIISETEAQKLYSREVHPRFGRRLREVSDDGGKAPSLALALPLRPLGGVLVDHTGDTILPKDGLLNQQGLRGKEDVVTTQKGSIRGAFAKIGRKFSSLATNLKRVAGITKSEDGPGSNNNIRTKAGLIQNSADKDTKKFATTEVPVSSTQTSGGTTFRRKEERNFGVGHRSKSSLCNVFNCNLDVPVVQKPNLARSVSNTPQEIEIRETARKFLKSEDGRTEVDTVVYRNNLGEQGGDLKFAHTFDDRTSLNGRVNGNNRGALKGDLDVTHSFSDRTSVNAHAYANRDEAGGDVALNHHLNDRTFVNLGVNGNSRGHIDGDVNVAHSLNDRTSLSGRAYASNQGDREGDISVKHKLNDRTSFEGHAFANNQGEIKGDIGVSQILSDSTLLRSGVSVSQGNWEGDLDVTHQVSDHTSLTAGVNGNTRGDFSGDIGVAHNVDGRTSLSGRTYGDNEGKFGGEVSLKRRLSDSTSVSAEAAANNRGEVEGRVGIEHQFSDSTLLGAGAHANSQGDVGVGLSITRNFMRRR